MPVNTFAAVHAGQLNSLHYPTASAPHYSPQRNATHPYPGRTSTRPSSNTNASTIVRPSTIFPMSSVTTCPEGFLAPPTAIPTSPTPSATSVSSAGGGGGGGSPGFLATSPMLSPGGSNTQSFVHKLFKMVNDATTDHIVRWTSSGESFIIDQAPEFEKLLPRYYKHSNISSFIRQANMYGFHKVNKAPRTRESTVRDYEFANPNFKRGRPDLLDNIRRKQPEKSASTSSTGSNSNDPLKQLSPDSLPGTDAYGDSQSSSTSASMFGSMDPSAHLMAQPLEGQAFDSVIAVSLASSASNLSLSSSTPASGGTGGGGGGFAMDGILTQGMQPTTPIAMHHHLNVGAAPMSAMLSMSPPEVSHSTMGTPQQHQQHQHQQHHHQQSNASLQSHLNHMHNRIHTLTEQLTEQRRIAQSHEVALIHISSWLRQQGVTIPFSPSAAPGTLDALTSQQQLQQQQQQQQHLQHQQAQVAIQLNGQFIQDESHASHIGYTSPTGSSLSPTASMGMDPLSLSRTGSMSPTQLALLAGISNVSPALTASMAALDMAASPNMHMLHVSGPGSRRGSMDTSAAGMMGLDPAMLMQMQQMQQQNQQQQQQHLMMQMQMQAQAQQQQPDGSATPLSVSSALDPMFMTQLNINGLGHQ